MTMISTVQRGSAPSQAAGLPLLQVALDPERMTASLGSLLLPLTRANGAPRITRARLLDYKPGKRALIRYEVEGLAGEKIGVVFGKLFSSLNRALRLYEIMRLLRGQVFAGETHLGVPQPLGCPPQLPMLVYLPARGHLLNKQLSSKQAHNFMDLAGMWLATLHRRRLPLDRRFELASELENLQRWSDEIGRTYSDQAETAGRLLNYLRDRAGQLPLETDIPIHKDFYHGHIIVNGQLNVIDFDEMRLGDPNLDLAHFCANFHLLACRKHNLAFPGARLLSAFLDSYANVTGWTPDERFVYFFVYTCLKIAWQRCIGSGPLPRPRGAEQHRQVRTMLEKGLMALLHTTDTPPIAKVAAVTGAHHGQGRRA